MKRAFILSMFLTSGFLRAERFEYLPGAVYDPAVPTLEQVLGYDFGDRITVHHDVERYLKVLEEASPRIQLVSFGESWEGRPLFYLIVTSKGNLARIEEIKGGMQKLSDPRYFNRDQAEELIEILPAVTWLTYGIHGNETSGTEAALLTAYHLAAVRDDPLVEEILQNTVVIIDPVQNPDGRDRFINHFRGALGPRPNPDQQAVEHREGWPSGRVNHYLFDMNRDWFAMTQVESRSRVKSFLEWFPVAFADLHEMGSDSTYYFPPAAPPASPHVTPEQAKLIAVYGKNNARWFDRFRFDYFTREVFDSFYPGYGTSWPMMHGSIGMTFEQASVRGLAVRKSDETVMLYRDAIRHHFVASLSTAETTAKNRTELLKYFYNYRLTAIEEGRREAVKEYILPPGQDPNRLDKLVALLMAQGVEVKVAEEAFKSDSVSGSGANQLVSREFPEGTVLISLAQPAKRLIRTLLDREVPMEKEFIDEQLRRLKERKPDQIYDVTSWSLPLLYEVELFETRTSSEGKFQVLQSPPHPVGEIVGDRAQLAYLIPWGRNSSAVAVSDLLERGIRLFFSEKPLKLNGVRFPAGSVIVKVKDNPDNLHAVIEEISLSRGVKIYATGSGWVEEGVNLGSGHVHYLKPPRIALAWSEPTQAYSAGWTRYVLEQMYNLPVTAIHTRNLVGAELHHYNVLILPNGSESGYERVLGKDGAEKVKNWVKQGGTLVTFAGGTHWLTEEAVGLLSTQRELKGGRPERGLDEPKKEEKKNDFSIEPERELPATTAGAILRVKLDEEHWLASGYQGQICTIFEGRNIFTPLKIDKGRNVGVFEDESKVVGSGFVIDEVRAQLAGKAYLMYQAHGRGHVVAFAQDPNYRAYFDGLNLLFLNPIFFGPGM